MVSIVAALGLFAMVGFINGQVPPPPMEKQYKCLLNRDCNPYDITKNEAEARVSGGSLGECKKSCDDLNEAKITSCKGFLWNEFAKTCWLKHTVCDGTIVPTIPVPKDITALYCSFS